MKPPMAKPTMPPPPPKAAMAKPSGHVAKTFAVKTWTNAGQGEKIGIYAPSGMGKTTLATMAPNPIFIGLDDGGRKTRNPKTGGAVNAVDGIETFSDLRDALHQLDLYPVGSSLVIDTITKVESLAEQHTVTTVKADDGRYPDSIEGYGWGKGYRHLLDTMRLFLSDLEPLVRRGVNIILLAQQGQATVSNLEGTDYAQDGMLLSNQPKAGPNTRLEVGAWLDNILRIGYGDVSVAKANVKAVKGKVSGSTERMIYTEPELYFVAKNRMNGDLPPVVSFATRDDDSIWKFLFPEQA
jgi:hypothetical protein